VKAITETGLFGGGVEKISLLSPIVVVKKDGKDRDGYWPVTVKFTFTYTMTGGRTTAPTERVSVFKLYKTKDAAGQGVWKVKQR
jgi:hypothetical protein